MSLFYRITTQSSSVVSCTANENAQAVGLLVKGAPGINNQSLQFIPDLSNSNLYYIRNDDDVYLTTNGNSVIGGTIENATKWLISSLPVQKISIADGSKWIIVNSGNLELTNTVPNVNWQVQVQDRHPLTLEAN